ncbi:hypothetical protein ES705_38937 [subsurface metagenome]
MNHKSLKDSLSVGHTGQRSLNFRAERTPEVVAVSLQTAEGREQVPARGHRGWFDPGPGNLPCLRYILQDLPELAETNL